MSLNKTTGICILKPLIIQTNPASGKTYFHRLLDNGTEVHRSYTLKPSDDLCYAYELKKDKFIDQLHEQLEARQLKKLKLDKPKDQKPLTEKQEKIMELLNKGMLRKDIAIELGVANDDISKNIGFIRRKGYIIPK